MSQALKQEQVFVHSVLKLQNSKQNNKLDFIKIKTLLCSKGHHQDSERS
jgi:hypothetical protein